MVQLLQDILHLLHLPLTNSKLIRELSLTLPADSMKSEAVCPPADHSSTAMLQAAIPMQLCDEEQSVVVRGEMTSAARCSLGKSANALCLPHAALM